MARSSLHTAPVVLGLLLVMLALIPARSAAVPAVYEGAIASESFDEGQCDGTQSLEPPTTQGVAKTAEALQRLDADNNNKHIDEARQKNGPGTQSLDDDASARGGDAAVRKPSGSWWPFRARVPAHETLDTTVEQDAPTDPAEPEMKDVPKVVEKHTGEGPPHTPMHAYARSDTEAGEVTQEGGTSEGRAPGQVPGHEAHGRPAEVHKNNKYIDEASAKNGPGTQNRESAEVHKNEVRGVGPSKAAYDNAVGQDKHSQQLPHAADGHAASASDATAQSGGQKDASLEGASEESTQGGGWWPFAFFQRSNRGQAHAEKPSTAEGQPQEGDCHKRNDACDACAACTAPSEVPEAQINNTPTAPASAPEVEGDSNSKTKATVAPPRRRKTISQKLAAVAGMAGLLALVYMSSKSGW